jgi:deoxyadenosine/deoxycytidine kinase/NTP pyrophosphatase (non-canonical NTP hydrolase)
LEPHFYIAIEGPIGVGKTTLARILQEELGGKVLLEVFEENPFLSDFYADRARYAFQTQIFFLLSRYRQQHQIVAQALQRGSLISDYLFAKDRLFALLNLSGDELAVYEHMHAALGEKIPAPQLVVHLWANTDILMYRIATRDRAYERSMSRQYIDDLRVAYQRFFVDYDTAPVLHVDTTDLDFVANTQDRRHVVGLVRSALQQGAFQPTLPEIALGLPERSAPILQQTQRRLGDFQRFHRLLDQEKGFIADLYLNFILLTEEVGELGRELARLWIAQYQMQEANGGQAPSELPPSARDGLRSELADVLAYLLKIANDAGIDLEAAYVEKMGGNWRRRWR